MPFETIPAAAGEADAAPIHGVSRGVLRAHALEQLPPSLRGAVARIELEETGGALHMGIEVDRVSWRAVWRRPGLPVASGSFAVWNGEPV